MALSLVPAAFWLWYLAGLGSKQPGSGRACLAAFGLGLLSPLVVLALPAPAMPNQVLSLLVFFVVAVGLVEETSKMLVGLLAVKLLKRRDTIDALLLGGCVALGFATTENVVYVHRFGETVILGRAMMSTFGHVLMSAFWAFALTAGARRLVGGLVAAAVVHGLYDWLLMIGWGWAAVGFLLLLWSIFRVRVVTGHLEASHRVFVTRKVVECRACHTLVRAEVAYCTQCGKARAGDEKIACRNCLVTVDPDAPSCPGCECRFA
ncbi:MAG: PrsW family intramembrane metalloprotease [Vulcanimicrobiota bacterium]